MPRVREPHWEPGSWPRPLCPGPNGEGHCGAPVAYYIPPGGEPAHEIGWTPDKVVMLKPCGHTRPAEDVGVAMFREPPKELDPHNRIEDAAQRYLKEYG